MIDYDNIVVRLIDLPSTVNGYTVPSPDGVYNIYINACHNPEIQRETYKHEIMHIYNDDFDKEKQLRCIEC